LLETIGHVPPVEMEAAYYQQLKESAIRPDSSNRASGKVRAVQCLSQWHSDTHSFVPTQEWLNRYRKGL
ncbi:MAG: hypothetical protein ACR2KU_08825, partial [Gammaproteobacteria bacterium]